MSCYFGSWKQVLMKEIWEKQQSTILFNDSYSLWGFTLCSADNITFIIWTANETQVVHER